MSIEYGQRDLSDGQRAYFAWLNAHYVTDEQAERIKAEFDRLRDENARLRELCRHLYTCNQYCDREDSDGGCSACPYQLLEYDCGFEERLLELGVEVES